MSSLLLTPVTLGDLALKNRVLMAPLTRSRAGTSRVPGDLMAEYYSQRAGAGLIISEATAVSAQGYGWANAPAMYTEEHEEGWRKVTKKVHERGGKIVLQLWHMGRVSHPDFQDGKLPVGPSATAAEGNAHTPTGTKPYVTPRALEASELPAIVQDYVRSAERAKVAGFDGVEIHGANGYLLDQFTRDGSNRRTDDYGGSAENRIRFPLEVIAAVSRVFGARKTGLRISPQNPYNTMSDSDPVETYTTYAHALNHLDLAYLHIMEPIGTARGANLNGVYVTPFIRKVYEGKIVANGSYDLQSAEKLLHKDGADAVAFGTKFIANPDLPARFEKGAALNEPRPETFYAGGAEGYTDYPFFNCG
ncbi:MAG: alkene reductase [Alphaproteobacteria bacterium]